MRELDELLLSYLTDQYPETGEDDKQTFRALLELSDPSLIEYLLQRVKPDSEPIARVVNNILNRNSA
jgi:succinate dehydrogenase flavin-adding protein (antitoxin of CptAB toxin-antitoxin module)